MRLEFDLPVGLVDRIRSEPFYPGAIQCLELHPSVYLPLKNIAAKLIFHLLPVLGMFP